MLIIHGLKDLFERFLSRIGVFPIGSKPKYYATWPKSLARRDTYGLIIHVLDRSRLL